MSTSPLVIALASMARGAQAHADPTSWAIWPSVQPRSRSVSEEFATALASIWPEESMTVVPLMRTSVASMTVPPLNESADAARSAYGTLTSWMRVGSSAPAPT